MIICDKCKKQIKDSKHLKYTKILIGTLREPYTEDAYDLCKSCAEFYRKKWLEVFGNEKVSATPENKKKILEFLADFFRNKEKVMFT